MGSGGGPEVIGIMADILALREIGADGEDVEGPPRRTKDSSCSTRALSSSNSALETYFSLATGS